MDRLNRLLMDFESSLFRLEEAVQRASKITGEDEYPFYRDSAIQRFEFTFEVMWRVVKVFLQREGIVCRSPRSCIRELFSSGFVSEEETRVMLEMLEDRNLTVHTYKEAVAEEIFERLPVYLEVLKRLLKVLKTERGGCCEPN